MATINDRRTEEQKNTHRWLVIGTDSFMSGWGGARGGASYAAWACATLPEAEAVLARISQRAEMKRVRIVRDGDGRRAYRPGRACSHLSIYVASEE